GAPRLGVAAALIAALLAAMFVAVAPNAHAASMADYVGTGAGQTIEGRIGNSGSWQSNWAGEMKIRLDGGATVIGFCIDFHTSISTSNGTDLPEVDWSTSGIANLNKVSYVLNTYNSSSLSLSGTANE